MPDREYFALRAAAERQLSELATDPCAAAVHAKMAACYEEMATGLKPKRPSLHIASGIKQRDGAGSLMLRRADRA